MEHTHTHRKVYSFYTASLFIQKSLPGTKTHLWSDAILKKSARPNSYDWPWGFPASPRTQVCDLLFAPDGFSFFFRVKMRPQMLFFWKITARYISVRFFFSLGRSWTSTTFTSELNSSLWTLPESNDATHFKPHTHEREFGRAEGPRAGFWSASHKTSQQRPSGREKIFHPKIISGREKMSQSETVGNPEMFQTTPDMEWRLTLTSGFRYTKGVPKKKKKQTYGMERRASARMREIVTR